MACLALLAASAVLFGACVPPPSDPGGPPTTTAPLPPPPGEFDVLAYNVAGLPQGISGSDPEANLPRISPLLDAYDVVLTQEDFDWWQPLLSLLDFSNYHRRLRADATHPYRSDRHPGPAAVGVDPARGMLVGDGIGLMARYPLLDEGHLAWSECFGGILPPGAADCLAMKGARVMTMVLGDGHEVDLYSLHVEAGSTPRDQQLQAQDLDELAGFIEARSAGRAVIVGGDWNLHVDPSTPKGADGLDAAIHRRFLERTGLVDVCDELDCERPASIDKFAYRSGGGVELDATRIDFPVERFSTPTGAPLSDHDPVVVSFDWDAA